MPDTLIYTVAEITRVVKLLIEENIPTIWVEGEISNFKAHYSGHFYFTLKDEDAQLSGVMWKTRTASLTFTPEDGMMIQALGNIRLYEKSGRYQIDIIRMHPSGVGRLQAEFERLKQKLDSEGLFDPSHKKPIPKYPFSVGIVTSETGAALQDIINVLNRRAPQVGIVLHPAKVQGKGAANEIAEGINTLNSYDKVDVIIVGRGGGSFEDLWPFNEEIVARAIYSSNIPVISAVGHEIDFTIADFVADLRAPTPSAAAELAVPDRRELVENVEFHHRQLQNILENRLTYLKENVRSLVRSYGLRRPIDLVHQYALQIDNLTGKLEQLSFNLIKEKRQRCIQNRIQLENLNPKNVLKRGYTLTSINGILLRNPHQVKVHDQIRTEFLSGSIKSIVEEIEDVK